MRNFGEHEGEPCLILGYRADSGNLLLIHLNDIAEGAEEDSMINFLQLHRNENDNLARIITEQPFPFMGFPSIIAYYSGKASHDGSASSLRQIPEFYVTLYDRQQCESWIGTPARFKPNRKSHRFLDRFAASLGQPLDPALLNTGTIVESAVQETAPVLEGQDALQFLQQNGHAVPEVLQTNVETVEPVEPAVEHATSGYSQTVDDIQPVNTPMNNDLAAQQLAVLQRIADQQELMIDQQAETTGQIKKMFRRFDEVDTSIRSAARNMEKAGFDKPETPLTKAQREKIDREGTI